MSTLTMWSDLDPETTYSAPQSSSNPVAAPSPVSGSSDNFWSPSHPMFGFGVLLGATAAALYVATERHGGAGAGVKARLGKASAGADIDLGGKK